MNSLWWVMGLTVVALALLIMLGTRMPHLWRISVRHIQRRGLRTVVIVAGLLLATLLIVTATIISDTLTLAVQRTAVANVGRVDETIVGGSGALGLFPAAQGDQVAQHALALPQVSGAAPALVISETLVIDATAQQVHGALNVLGLVAEHAGPLGDLGDNHHLSDLTAGQAYINSSAAGLLHTTVGDQLAIYSVHWARQSLPVRVRAIIPAGPLGNQPTILLPLAQLQAIAGATDSYNRIYLANAGDGLSGVGYSQGIRAVLGPALPAGWHMQLVKLNAVNYAEQTDALFGHILTLYTLFALAVDVLLIFLIFALLAAERRVELGTLRALGLHRPQIILTLLFEAAIYNLAAALPGILLGIGLGFLLVIVITPGVAHLGFTLSLNLDAGHLALALCAGLLFALIITGAAIALTSRVSIAAALRNQPEPPAEAPSLAELWRTVKEQMMGRRAVTGRAVETAPERLRRRNPPSRVRYTLPSPSADGEGLGVGPAQALGALAWGLCWRGMVPTIVGLGMLPWGVARGGLALAGVVGLVWVGIVLLIRWRVLVVRAQEIQARFVAAERLPELVRATQRADRVTAFVIGGVVVGYWALPMVVLPWAGRFAGGIGTFFGAGILMVLGLVLALLPNLDLALRPLQGLAARFAHGRHVTAIGLIYPAHQRLRTGIGFALFGLVCFVMVVMACIASSTTQRYSDISALTGGYDIVGEPLSQPIGSISALTTTLHQRAPTVARQIQQISAAHALPLAMVQPNGNDARWQLYPAAQIDGAFLQGAGLPLAARAQGFASDDAVWQAVRLQPGDVVIDAGALDAAAANALGVQVPPQPDLPAFAAPPIVSALLGQESVATALSQPATQSLLQQSPPEVRGLLQDPAKQHALTLQLTNLAVHNGAFTPIPIWIADFRSQASAQLMHVVGIVANVQGQRYGLLGSPATFATMEAGLPPVGNDYYYFQLTRGANAEDIARALGTALIGNGFETTVVRQTLLNLNAPAIFASQVLLRLVALMLLVGTAALMITGLRGVVERRQQIGMLRALGFHRRDVQAIFLMEALLVALGGALTGLGVGLILCQNALAQTFLAEAQVGLALVIPWGSLAFILLIAVGASLAAVALPARQASSIAPAEALRYE